MEETAARLLRSIRHVAASGEGAVTMRGGDQGDVVGRLEPILAEVLRRADDEDRPIAATLISENRERHRVVLWPLLNADGALAIELAALQDRGEEPIERLVNHIAHDVRNIAFTIGLQAELAERSPAPPEVGAHLSAVLRQVDALKSYLEKLLLFGRRVRLEPTACPVAGLVARKVAELRLTREPDAPALDVRVVAPEALGEARWDAAAIGRALDELLDNALRSSDPPPPVTVTVEGDADSVCIEVRDEGPGISAEIQARLAEPMAARRPGGAGLGLAIVRKLVRAHGGTLRLETGSTGTTVTLELPRELRTV